MKAIDDKDEKAFLDIVNESGLSSRYKLQNTYSPAGKITISKTLSTEWSR